MISERRAYFTLQIAAQRARVVADELFASSAGLSAGQAAALALIAAEPGCSQRRLADTFRQRESAITGMVSRLVKAGLAERRVSGADRRSWELWPSKAGMQALTRARPALAHLNTRIAAAIGDEGIEPVLDALDALASL